MDFDMMTGACAWSHAQELAAQAASIGYSGMVFTEAGQTPWMAIAAAAMKAPSLTFSTGIAVAFARSPMISAQIAWELAGNTRGNFRLGLGSQVRGHIKRRYASMFDKPAPQLRDYVLAVRACLNAFRGEELDYRGRYYQLSLLTDHWKPLPHEFADAIKLDISAVGPYMCKVAGEVADGLHVHPMHSSPYIKERLLPDVAAGALKAGRSVDDVDLIIPVMAVPGDSPEERESILKVARRQIGFYACTPNYAFQLDTLGFSDTREKLVACLKAGDMDGLGALVSDDILEHFAVVAKWDDLADKLIDRYQGIAQRLVMYHGRQSLEENPQSQGKWAEIARAVRAA
ncbi:MAG: TIGR03617 family F420-dependent LLM class oxidoreductase [Chromatiales bacterium]|jgi:probable F420-dependent oxidoreductase|nr:TIGR03617 family F420-dependent LLM class oxidoreductase [Chromatiales bacterium]